MIYPTHDSSGTRITDIECQIPQTNKLAWYSFDQINLPYIEVSIIVVLGFDLLLFIKIHESKFSRLRSQDETITYRRMT
ncbi:hypothetical protein BDP67DRAFT_621428 [Colletotrichum lupini]|nr:hypothetical protein BDP67DRAFT_621428 [Colletotrichum lupini]